MPMNPNAKNKKRAGKGNRVTLFNHLDDSIFLLKRHGILTGKESEIAIMRLNQWAKLKGMDIGIRGGALK